MKKHFFSWLKIEEQKNCCSNHLRGIISRNDKGPKGFVSLNFKYKHISLAHSFTPSVDLFNFPEFYRLLCFFFQESFQEPILCYVKSGNGKFFLQFFSTNSCGMLTSMEIYRAIRNTT